MKLKKPKTTHNFKLFNEIGVWFLNRWMDEDIALQDERFSSTWDAYWSTCILDDPILFWYMMIIVEEYNGFPPTHEIELNTFTKPENYRELIEELDQEIGSETECGDMEIYYQCAYSMALFRLIGLTGAFYAFDIRNISLTTYADEVGKKILKEALLEFKNKTPSDLELDNLYMSLGELGEMDKKKRVRKMTRDAGQDVDEERVWIGDEEFYDVFPFDGENKRLQDIWFEVTTLGKYLKVHFDFDNENMEKLTEAIDGAVLLMMDDQASLTHSFIKIAKKCEKIGNTLYIPFEKLFTPNFPLLQYIYHLEKMDGCSVASWAIEDDWIVTIYDETIADALGMSRAKKKTEVSKEITYDFKKEVLCVDGKALSLGDVNEVFVRMFFDLERNGTVSIDELAESIDPIVIDMDKNARSKAEKSLVYDRVPALNGKLNKELGIEKCFTIENRKVKLSFLEILENSSKDSRKK